MDHLAFEQIFERCERAKEDSDFHYFTTLLYAGELLTKLVVAGMLAGVRDDTERSRYAVEYTLARASGVGEWSASLDQILSGPCAQFLCTELQQCQRDLTQNVAHGSWQHEAVILLQTVAKGLDIQLEEWAGKTDLKRWFRSFASLRNKTRGHGANSPAEWGTLALNLDSSIRIVANSMELFRLPWAYLYRNLSGKHRISRICGDTSAFNHLSTSAEYSYAPGVYLYAGAPRAVPLIKSDPSLEDFYFANGSFGTHEYEMLSYATGSRAAGESSGYSVIPGALPPSETHGHGEFVVRNKWFTNAPTVAADYVQRPRLEEELTSVLLDDRRTIVTLHGRGGIGKTSLALAALEAVSKSGRFDACVWLSARDVDLQMSGPKPVRPAVASPTDMARLYAALVRGASRLKDRTFKPLEFFQQELTKSEFGPTLFVFDNFETTESPVDMFKWIDQFARLPNKVLITTRLRDFKADFPVDVGGMETAEAKILISRVAASLGITELLTDDYINELITESGGHPYAIKILLGNVANDRKLSDVERVMARTEDILAALLGRTYAALSPCAQRAFLTLASWKSAIPRVVLEAVLLNATGDRPAVEDGIDSLLKFSMAESETSPVDGQVFISLPLVSTVFGRKKLNVHPLRTAIQADGEVLQMLGPVQKGQLRSGLDERLDRFVRQLAVKVDRGTSFESFRPVIEMVCTAYPAGWFLLGKWQWERGDGQKAEQYLRSFLEQCPADWRAANAWEMLGKMDFQEDRPLEGIHAFIERAQLEAVPFFEVSATANKLNGLFRSPSFAATKDERRVLASRILDAMQKRKQEANADDLSRMAWLAMNSEQFNVAKLHAEEGLKLDGSNIHCLNVVSRLAREAL